MFSPGFRVPGTRTHEHAQRIAALPHEAPSVAEVKSVMPHVIRLTDELKNARVSELASDSTVIVKQVVHQAVSAGLRELNAFAQAREAAYLSAGLRIEPQIESYISEHALNKYADDFAVSTLDGLSVAAEVLGRHETYVNRHITKAQAAVSCFSVMQHLKTIEDKPLDDPDLRAEFDALTIKKNELETISGSTLTVTGNERIDAQQKQRLRNALHTSISAAQYSRSDDLHEVEQARETLLIIALARRHNLLQHCMPRFKDRVEVARLTAFKAAHKLQEEAHIAGGLGVCDLYSMMRDYNARYKESLTNVQVSDDAFVNTRLLVENLSNAIGSSTDQVSRALDENASQILNRFAARSTHSNQILTKLYEAAKPLGGNTLEKLYHGVQSIEGGTHLLEAVATAEPHAGTSVADLCTVM